MWSRRDRKRTYSILCKILSLLFCLYYLMSKLSSYILGQSILRIRMEGMVKMVIFMVLLLVGFFYIIKSARMGIRNYKHWIKINLYGSWFKFSNSKYKTMSNSSIKIVEPPEGVVEKDFRHNSKWCCRYGSRFFGHYPLQPLVAVLSSWLPWPPIMI
jgi:hypothetical protein